MDAITFDEVEGLVTYWKQNPPVHISLGILLHAVTGAKEDAAHMPTPDELQHLAETHGGGKVHG